jgi:hypothetical protein
MAITVRNLQTVPYTVPHLPGPVNLGAAGTPTASSNVTSEIRDLTGPQYADLQSDQSSGKLYFTKDDEDQWIETPGLTISASHRHYDEAMDSRGSVLTPASPVYFDASGQAKKCVQVDSTASAGAFDIDFWGSMDVSTLQMVDKKWSFLGRIRGSDPSIYAPDEKLCTKMQEYRFLKADLRRGVSPRVIFQSTY